MSIDLSLDRLRRLASVLPPYRRPTIHIAGTNGKGSVSAIVSSILASTSPTLRVGRYNSPHLVTIYDCITLDQRPISSELYDKTRKTVEAHNEKEGLRLTNFELLTVTALQAFEAENVDVVVLEVGMGGRLDATNIIPDAVVLVSALTAVDLDHQAFLGDTIEKIAREKAAIVRPGKPFVLGRQEHPEVSVVAQEVVEAVGARLIPSVPVVISPESYVGSWSLFNQSTTIVKPPTRPQYRASMKTFSQPLELRFPLEGDHQTDNLATALAIIDTLRILPQFEQTLTLEAIQHGVEAVRWPGRLSFHAVAVAGHRLFSVLVDGAHNAASARTLGRFIQSMITRSLAAPTDTSPSNSKPKIYLTYLLALSYSPTKPPLETLTPILSMPDFDGQVEVEIAAAALAFTPPEGMPWVKHVPVDEIVAAVNQLVPNANTFCSSGNAKPLDEALRWASEIHDVAIQQKCPHLVVLAGSLYLVADFYRMVPST